MKAVFDSDVLIDYLQGLGKARAELARYTIKQVSIISWMEILAGADTPEEQSACRAFLDGFIVQPVTAEVAEEAVRIRQRARIRLPDAIVWATARTEGALLVTRNTKDFPKGDPGVRVPYRVG